MPYRIVVAVGIKVEAERIDRLPVPRERNGRAAQGVLGGEPSDPRVVVPRAQIVGADLAVEVLPAVAEGVRIQRLGIDFVAEGVVPVGPEHIAARVQPVQHVAVRVEEIVLQRAVHLPRDQPGPTDVPRVQGARRADLGHDVLPVPQVDVRRRGAPASGRFAVPQAVRTVGEAGGTGWTGNSFQLPKPIIRPRFGAVNKGKAAARWQRPEK